MGRILTDAGRSLADTYQADGSSVGIERLETRELPIVHEMGATVFSERFQTTQRRQSSGGVIQNTAINLILTDLPAAPTRILGVAVISDDATRIARCVVETRDPIAGRDFPIWVWNPTDFETIDMEDAGGGVGVFELLIPHPQLNLMPNFVGGSGQPQTVDQIALRALTTGFGAGTVFIRVHYYSAFSEVVRPASGGLPIPSW